MTDDTPEDHAQRLVERIFAPLGECRTIQRALETPRQDPEPAGAEAGRVLYYTLLGVLESGLVRTMEDALTILQQASQPLGPRGADWLARQEAQLDQGPEAR